MSDVIKIRARAGEPVGGFAVRMTELRDDTSTDFIAVHNDREVLVERHIGTRKFLKAWEAAGKRRYSATVMKIWQVEVEVTDSLAVPAAALQAVEAIGEPNAGCNIEDVQEIS